jgi:hypothetical protein
MVNTYLSLLWLCYLSSSYIITTCGFNLAPKHAVVFKDPTGQEESHFGYTVALQHDDWWVPRLNHFVSRCTTLILAYCVKFQASYCTSLELNKIRISIAYFLMNFFSWVSQLKSINIRHCSSIFIAIYFFKIALQYTTMQVHEYQKGK